MKINFRQFAYFLATALLFPTFANIAYAQDDSADFPYLSGNLGGTRTSLLEKGIDVQALYTADVFSNLSGGIERGTMYMDNLDITAEFDGSKLYGIEGSKIFIYLLNNNGGKFNEKRVGSHDGIDNIEVSEPTFKLFEAWIEQNFLSDTLSVRAGLYNLNSEFDVTESSGVFINPTFGIDTAYAATGQNGPSIFPTSSVAARVKIAPTEELYLQAAVLDGVPGDIDDPEGTHIDFDDNDGVLVAVEAGYGNLDAGRIGVGGWWYSEEFDHLSEIDASGDPLQERGDGFYGFAEKTLYRPDGDESRHLDGFIRFAFANDEVSQFDYSGSIGVAYTGPFESRKDDVAAIAFHGAHNGDPSRDAALAAGEPIKSGEWGIEATYSVQVTPWLVVQPDFQYISDPGTVPGIDHATVAGLRLKFSL